ncbi:MAG: STAS domain-containing protein [Gammaproteobacteria bacterium]
MFEIEFGDDGQVVVAGRLDAAQAEKAQSFLDRIPTPRVIDMRGLEYISSAGLGVLLKTQKRLMAAGGALKLINVNHHISEVFRYSGFDRLFEVVGTEDPGPRN